MAGDGSDQRALQYEQTLVSPDVQRVTAAKFGRKLSAQGKSVRVRVAHVCSINRQVCVALECSERANKRAAT